MYSQSVGASHNVPTFAPFADNAAPTKATAASEATQALSAYEASAASTEPHIRGKRDTIDFVIGRMAGSVEEIIGSDRLRGELDRVVAAVKNMNVTEIEIKAYNPILKEPARSRGNAVKAYLIMKGVDSNLIDVTLRGPGYGNKDSGIAKEKGVRIEIYGSPKSASLELSTRAAYFLMA
ncbi:OmpA-like domain-containing protein [Bordetella sputigena]|uniref:hypothetical protein n=1 Tax=Bordetella sputigena TaxID=1416810 RepID=UPI0039F0D39A